jgi:hypothetical protein
MLIIVAAALPAHATDFARDVRPILVERCWRCHGPEKQKAGLRFDRKADAMRGGDTGPLLVAGKSGESLLIRKVTNADAAERMPPTGDALTEVQIKILKSWIDEGAVWPDDSTGTLHWSFRPVVRPTLPASDANWARQPIDRFILAKLQQERLQPSVEADRVTLIRRLKFDLLGLPPTPEEIDRFLTDGSPNAYEQLVDRFLTSPQYGERWARHWLDVVRFAESNGFETNTNRPNAWPYRDYVIHAFNEDKPYDRFVIEQLAGDALGVDAATGFLVAGAYDEVKSPDVGLTLQQRADELHDMVATSCSTFLGLTVGCARCHHHKFDPVSQQDYYAVKAVFAGVHHGERPMRDPVREQERVTRLADLRKELAVVEQEIERAEPLADPTATSVRRAPVSPRRNIERIAPVQARFIRFTILATNNLEPCIDELEVFTAGPDSRNVALASLGTKATASGTFEGSDRHRLEHINDGRFGNNRSWISNESGRGWVQLELAEPAMIDRIVWARDREGQFKDRLPTRYQIEVGIDANAMSVVATSDDREPVGTTGNALNRRWKELDRLVREAERPVMVYAGTFATAEPIKRLHRGEPMQPRESVAPGSVTAVGLKFEMPLDAPESDRRLELAKWITNPANPLTARVMVNRLWQYHFGRGIVDTPGDFGRNGGVPSHPELLDWLAAEFVEHGWSIKHVHRLIVTSASYRQSSTGNAKGMAADAQTRLLWRFPPRRLEAEAIRDAVLAVSGALDLRMGGPGFDLFEPNSNYVKVYTPKREFGPAEYRRMIYQSRPRMQPDDTFGAFDCPEGGQIAPKRTVSTTPLQALNLLNSPFMLQQAELFARRIDGEAKANAATKVRRAFRLAFGREPSEIECDAAVRLINDHGLAALCRSLFNANEFLFIP